MTARGQGLACSLVTLAVFAMLVTASAAFALEPPARAGTPRVQPAEPDTSLEGFLGGLSDSTDRYFGLSAAPADTAGNDSALAYALENPWSDRRGRRFGISAFPDFTFNRVDGPVWGGRLAIGRAVALGQVFGGLGYAAGPNVWLGFGGYRRSVRVGDGTALLELSGGRRTAILERERSDRYLASFRALINGRDFHHYYRRDGFTADLEYRTETWRTAALYRDELESPLVTNTTWNFANRTPIVVDNFPATFGRVREVGVEGAWRLPILPVTAEVRYLTSGKAIGIARLLGDVGTAQGALALVFDDFLEAVVMLIVGAAALLFVSWQLSLVMLLVGPSIFATIALFGRRIRKSAHRRQREFAGVTSRLIEILEGIKVIKAFRAEDHEQDGFARSTRRLFRRGMRVAVNRTLARTFIDLLNNAAAAGVLVVGIWLVLHGRWGLTVGDLAAFGAITITLYRPVRALARGWVRVMDAEPSAQRYFEVLDSPIEIRDAENAVAVPRIRDSVRFEHVTFSYGREPVLQDVSFEARAGEVLAIVGRTGAGKTTLVDLLLRFYDPTSGRITFDGVELRGVSRSSLLDQMAVVSQEPFLFDGTIRENIRYGRLDASEEEILAAARAAHVDEFVAALPQGYDTEVGAAGTRLSGGQRQRVTIARAILRDPAILVLDEATSSLDSKSEKLVQDAIDKLLPGRTVFVIAHRLSTVRAAHKIVVLERGRVSQLGNHDELIAQGGLYREFVELQSGAIAAEPS